MDSLNGEDADMEPDNDEDCAGSPVFAAASSGQLFSLRLLVSKNMNLEWADRVGNRAAHVAAHNGHHLSLALFVAGRLPIWSLGTKWDTLLRTARLRAKTTIRVLELCMRVAQI